MTLPADLFAEAISLKQMIFVAMTLGFWSVAIPAAIRFAWMDRVCLAGILFMAINPIDVTFFSYTNYRGDIRGIEFGITDWLAITLAVAMFKAPRWKKRRLYFGNPNQWFMFLYLTYSIFTIATAIIPQFAFFGVTKLVRAYLTFWIAFNFIRSESDLRFFVWCCVGLTFYSFSQVLMDKYVRGIFPPRGSFPHQNSLSSFQNMVNFVVFAYLMQDGKKLFDKRTLVYWAAAGAGSLTTVATLSRGGMATMVMGYLLIIFMTFFLKQEKLKVMKKVKSLSLMAFMSLPVLAFILPEIIKRFTTAPEESGNSRHDANISASEMGSENFFGVGLNNYSFAINFMKYGLRLGELDRGIAHHIFWLHYAEMGLIGVILFTLLTGGFMWHCLRFILQRHDSVERVLAIGIFAAFVVVWLIGTLEWAFRQIQITLAYFTFAGIAMSLVRVEKDRHTANKQARRKSIIKSLMLQQLLFGQPSSNRATRRPQ